MQKEEISRICECEVLEAAATRYGTSKEASKVFPEYEGAVMKRERAIKSLPRDVKMALIQAQGIVESNSCPNRTVQAVGS